MIQPTSTASYHEEKKKGLTERHQEIISALRDGGAMTDRELQQYLGKADANEIRPRRNELASINYGMKIKEASKRSCRVTGKKAIVWTLNESRPQQIEMFAA